MWLLRLLGKETLTDFTSRKSLAQYRVSEGAGRAFAFRPGDVDHVKFIQVFRLR